MSLIRSDSCTSSYVYANMGSLEHPRKFHNQDFEMLREWHVKRGILFEDESFPANLNSIGLRLKKEFNTHNIVWRRPPEICGEPHFTVDGTSLFDILQSKLGDCWVLSAIGSITLKPGLLEKIMPQDQGFSRYYAGIFHFRLWHLGEWVDIVIDDKLPFLDGKYLSVQPSCENEFWPCLLEKAYAKFLGSYENLHWGDPAEAFVNLTGGLTMTFDLKSTEAHTYWNMISLASPDTLMACISDKQDPTLTHQGIRNRNIRPNSTFKHPSLKNRSMKPRIYAGNRRSSGLNDNHPEQFIVNAPEDFHTDNINENKQNHPEQFLDGAPEDLHRDSVDDKRQMFRKDVHGGNMLTDKLPENVLLANGLVERHAYSITDYAQVPFRDGFVKLIRIWNPWGFGEWRGDWNDRCPLWKELREEDRQRLQRIGEDGEFWMCWEDFMKEFSRLIISSQVPDFFDWGDQHRRWYKKMFRSRWTKDNISWNNIDKDFWNKNPLYSIKVTGSDEVQSGVNVVISLMQTSRNRQKFGDWLPIGFLLFELPDTQDKPLTSFLNPEKISCIKSFKKHDVTEAFKLSPGKYGIIPYTTQKEHESSFLFQVFLKSEDCTDEMGPQKSLTGVDVPKHESIFRLYATKGSKLYAWDLKRLLNDTVRSEYPYPYGAKFTIDGSREILASADINKKGKIDAGAFAPLWQTITQYKNLFSNVDVNRCGYLSVTEFCKIIHQSGLNVHNDLLHHLFARYSNAEGKLSFVDFLTCTVRLKGILKTFYALSTDGKGAYVQYDKWMHLMM